MYSLDVSTEGGRFGNTCMASLGSYGAPIQTQCQFPTLKRDPLVKVKHSLVWGGFCFCFPYADISKAASPATFLGKQLSTYKPQGVISHGVISIIFDLFVYCLPVLVNAQWATSPPPWAHRPLPAGFWDAAERCRSHEHLLGHSHNFRSLHREGRPEERAGQGRGTLPGWEHRRWPSHRDMKELPRLSVPGWRSSKGATVLRLLFSNGRCLSLLASEEKPLTQPTWLRQVLGRGAASKSSSRVPSICVHSPSSLEINLSCPFHPLAAKPAKGHVFMLLGKCCASCLPVSSCRDSTETNKLIHKAGRENKMPETPFIAEKTSSANVFQAPVTRSRRRNVYIQ